MIAAGAAVEAVGVGHRYGDQAALAAVDFRLEAGDLVGIIGPDGVGKSTLLGLIAGVRRMQRGEVRVLGADLRKGRDRARAAHRIAYMPQGLGQNLYPELSVAENIAFFGALFELPAATLRARRSLLMEATGLTAFAARPAGKLSGGMKQKLGLCCALIHQPELLILDEPTTGIDPLSRLQFWALVQAMRRQSPRMATLVATSYMAEAEGFDRLYMMDAGAFLDAGAPNALMAQTGSDNLDDAYVTLLPEARRRDRPSLERSRASLDEDRETAVEACELTRRFDGFTAVDAVSFRIRRGEIFGFVGPNGSGKTTTMKMVTGLLRPSAGEARLFGRPVQAGDRQARHQLGYMSQSFSLYGELSVFRNLALHARLFDLPADEIAGRVDVLLQRFGLREVAQRPTRELPLGLRQRLSLAVATIHRPQILILDEPTSGVDPVARDQFWALLLELSREQGTTIFVSTHYLSEATRCDRLALMNRGRMLAYDSPEALVEAQGAEDLESAFIAFIREDRQADDAEAVSAERIEAVPQREDRVGGAGGFRFARLWALSVREGRQILRDRFRMFSAFMVPLALMLIFGFGLNVDVEDLPYAAFDQDDTPQSRRYLEQFTASRYFVERAPIDSDAALERRFQSGELAVAVEIPPGFGRDVVQGDRPEAAIWIDGTMPYYAETARGYAQLLHATYLRDLLREERGEGPARSPVNMEIRYWYNQGLKSKFAFVPGTLAVILIMIPAMLTAVAVVREKEMGSITNLYATPVSRLEFLWGKQLPYVAIGFLNFLLLTLVTVTVFAVPLKGSFVALALGALLFVLAATGIGLVVSSFTRSQVAASIVTLLLTMVPSFQYSGLLSPVSALEGGAKLFGQAWPTTYFLNISVGAFTKDLDVARLLPNFLILALMFVVLSAAGVLLLRQQQR